MQASQGQDRYHGVRPSCDATGLLYLGKCSVPFLPEGWLEGRRKAPSGLIGAEPQSVGPMVLVSGKAERIVVFVARADGDPRADSAGFAGP